VNDDQLRDQLDRRATSGPVPDLLPSISARLDVRQSQPARLARWTPLAGLAAAAALLVALVIVLPHSPIGNSPLTPRVTPASVSSQPSNAPAQTSLDAMSTQEFASALQGGTLAARTVLVDGGVVAYDGPAIFGSYCGPYGPSCVLGQMEGVQPRVIVFGADIAVPSASDASVDYGCGLLTSRSAGSSPCTSAYWPLWTTIAPPIRGILVLSIDQTGTVNYVGRAVPNGDQLPWSAGQVENQLDLNARGLDDAILVNAWLTGLDFPAPCASPILAFPDLPQTSECGRLSWLADEPAVIDPDFQAVPQSAIQVQPEAFRLYSPDPSARSGDSLQPQRAVYAVAKRLYGGSCIDPSQPCWDWSIIGRLSQPAPDLAPPSLAYVPTPEIAPTPTVAPLSNGRELSCGSTITLADWTGLVASCASNVIGDTTFTPGAIVAPSQIDVLWLVDTCSTASAKFQESNGGYRLIIEENMPSLPSGQVCAGVGERMSLTVTLSAAVAVAISATVNGQELPTLSPPPTALATAAAFECGTAIKLMDTTGAVVACSDAGGRDYHSQDAHISVDPGNPFQLDIWWGQSNCAESYQIKVSPAPSGLPQPADYEIAVSTQNQTGCDFMPDAHAASIDFASPVDASRIRLTINDQPLADPIPCAPASDLVDAGDGVDIFDSPDLIMSCMQRQPSAESAGRVSNLTDSSLVVRWTDRPCGVPIHLMFESSGGGGFVLGKLGQCMVTAPMTYEIVISFVQQVSAASVDASGLSISK
jgi:hypothetical protein